MQTPFLFFYGTLSALRFPYKVDTCAPSDERQKLLVATEMTGEIISALSWDPVHVPYNFAIVYNMSRSKGMEKGTVESSRTYETTIWLRYEASRKYTAVDESMNGVRDTHLFKRSMGLHFSWSMVCTWRRMQQIDRWRVHAIIYFFTSIRTSIPNPALHFRLFIAIQPAVVGSSEINTALRRFWIYLFSVGTHAILAHTVLFSGEILV